MYLSLIKSALLCLPDFTINLQIEEDKGEEGHDARDDDVVPPSSELHVLLVLEYLRHFVVDLCTYRVAHLD